MKKILLFFLIIFYSINLNAFYKNYLTGHIPNTNEDILKLYRGAYDEIESNNATFICKCSLLVNFDPYAELVAAANSDIYPVQNGCSLYWELLQGEGWAAGFLLLINGSGSSGVYLTGEEKILTDADDILATATLLIGND